MSHGVEQAGGRLAKRAQERAGWLGAMRKNVLGFVVTLAGGQFLMTAIWLAALLSGNEGAARAWGLMTVFMNLAITIVIVYLTWMVLEALGRIDREADRMQVFLDNAHRRR